jgi:hypothetical protein
MARKTFEESIDQIVELDPSLDINTLLSTNPTEDEPPIKEVEVDDNKATKKEKELLKDINSVLEDVKTVEEKAKKGKVDKEINDDNKAPATITKPEETSDAPFTVIFAKDLVAQGLISSFDEDKFTEDVKELGEADALRNLIKNEIIANSEAYKSDYEEGYQQYLQMIGKGVAPESAGSLIELKTKFDGIKVDDLSKEENTSLRKQVMVDYFKLTTSMPDAKIERLVQSSIDLGDDVEDSKEYLTTLKTLVKEQITAEETEAEKTQKLQAEENRRNIEALKEEINTTSEIVQGMPINKQTKTSMFEALTKPVQDNKGRTTNAVWAKRAEDPSFFDQRLAYLYSTGFFEKGKPWNKIATAKVTKEVNALEEALKHQTSKAGITTMRNTELDKTSKDNIESMRGIFGR